MEESVRFIQNFSWTTVRKYSVNIAVEQLVPGLRGGRIRYRDWDEEVELYDIRGKRDLDYDQKVAFINASQISSV